MSLGDIYQVDLHSVFQGNRNIMCFNCMVLVDPASDPIGLDLANYFEASFIPGLAPLMHTGKNWDCIETQLKSIKAALCEVNDLKYQQNIDIDGTLATSPGLPGQCSLVVQTFQELVATDANNRGRDFWQGFIETQQVDGEWVQATWDSLQTVLDGTIMGGFEGPDGGEYGWVNYSPTLAKARCALPGGTDPLTADTAWFEITFLRALKQVRTQRRRQAENPCDQFLN